MQHGTAGSGLNKMFIAQIGAVICSILMVVPLVNFIALIGILVFLIISLIGLNEAGKEIEGCKNAFFITIARLALNALSRFLGTGVLGVIFSIAISVTGFLIVYFVCSSVAQVLRARSYGDIASNGEIVWKINLACYAAEIVISLLVCIPVLSLLAFPASVIVTIAALVAGILYMVFLYKSSQVL